jgi:DNA modification methylase
MMETHRTGEAQATQLSLPTLADESTEGFGDPAFTGNKGLPIHRWAPWIAGFSASFVREALDRRLQSRGTVLDPFCGVGTTLVEGLLAGHRAVGFEINPYAALASRAKTEAGQVDPEALDTEIARFLAFYGGAVRTGASPRSTPPTGFRTKAAFYSAEVQRKVLIFHDFLPTVHDRRLRDLFRLAFGATMVSYSNYSYEPSLSTRAAVGRPGVADSPVGEIIAAKLKEMAHDIRWLRHGRLGRMGSAHVVSDSFFGHRKYLAAGSADLIVTSPPYLNNYHYNRNTRPQLYWLGYARTPRDLKALEKANFGKYWQTVREQEVIPLAFSLPNSDMADRLQALRAVNADRRPYGGAGWANYAASYFNDCYRFAKAARYALREGGTALVVIGNSILQGILIPTDRYFASIAESVGLSVADIHVPRATRVGNSIIKSEVRVGKARDSHQLYEAVVELRRE